MARVSRPPTSHPIQPHLRQFAPRRRREAHPLLLGEGERRSVPGSCLPGCRPAALPHRPTNNFSCMNLLNKSKTATNARKRKAKRKSKKSLSTACDGYHPTLCLPGCRPAALLVGLPALPKMVSPVQAREARRRSRPPCGPYGG